jgi:hypothetical protein
MKLEPLYRLEFDYRPIATVELGEHAHGVLRGEGRCDGRVSGAWQGFNRARSRGPGLYEPDFHGAIQTDDGATILWDIAGVAVPEEARGVLAIKHVTADERYAFLNDVLCVGAATFVGEGDARRVSVDVAEVRV